MEYLPAEILLKILKNLNFDELFKIKQNKYFCEFINKYKDELARKRFKKLYFIASDYVGYNQVNLLFNSQSVKDMANKFTLSNHLEEKWISALDKKIPVFISSLLGGLENYGNKKPLLVFRKEGQMKKDVALKLPLFPQNIEELKIVRYWLLKISSCVFDLIEFRYFHFNQEMIKLLFDNEEIIELKFNCRKAVMPFPEQDIDSWKCSFNHLVISENISIRFQHCPTREEDDNILLKLLSNAGDRIPLVEFVIVINSTTIYNLLINHLETSTDLSKIVDRIRFICKIKFWRRSRLIPKGIETSESNNRKKCFKITNKHDPKIKFSILWNFTTDDFFEYIEIIRIK